jgi:hypothetical protein
MKVIDPVDHPSKYPDEYVEAGDSSIRPRGFTLRVIVGRRTWKK